MLPTLLLALAPCLPQDPASNEALQSLLDQAKQAGPAAVLQLADQSDLLTADDWQEQALEILATSDGPSKLLLIRLLTQAGGMPDPNAVLGLLNGEREMALAALATLDLGAFDGDEAIQTGLIEWLGEQVPDDDAQLFCEASLVLYNLGDGPRRRAALRHLGRTRESLQDYTVQQGALALGRTAAVLEADTMDVLEVMAAGIGADAPLARALLKQEDQRARFRSKLEALEQLHATNQAQNHSSTLDSGDVELLERILLMAQRDHMEGGNYSREEMLAGAASGMLNVLDPYSTYFSGDEYRDFWFDLNPEYGGIGAYVNTINGIFTIIRPIYSGPAYKVGLLSDDRIFTVDGWSTVDQPNDEVIKRLKGPPGTEVKLEVFRDGWTEPKEIVVERQKIELPVLQQEMLPGNVLYLELIGFTVDCGYRVATAIHEAQKNGELSGVVLDLRNNPGGSLSQAVRVCDVFLPPNKLIVTTRARIGEVERHQTRAKALVPEDIPLTILTNEHSASASEIVAGALSIHGRATTIGERTHGKGSVQQLRPLPGMDDEPFNDENRNRQKDEWEEYDDVNGNGQYDFGPKVKLTIAYYFLPDGSTIHTQRDHEGKVIEKGGVEPDITVAFGRYEPIVLRELNRLLDEDKFNTYAQKLYDADTDLAVQLAEYDARSTEQYPGWADYYLSLETYLEEDIVRQWVRRQLRTMVSDLRGKMFPGGGFRGDFEEDPQLQAAIAEVLKAIGSNTSDVPEYATVFAKKEKPKKA
ncbi:MAG: S41 family peptidase [Planctomycetes bacterium]|nr:S41 family peptidase [Planctomycetota bacterium]